MPLEDHIKALKNGLITQKQYDKLPPHLLTAIVKSKTKPKKPVPKNSHRMKDGTIMKDSDMPQAKKTKKDKKKKKY